MIPNRHSGLDPESSAFSKYYTPGCRIKSGMTSRIYRIFELRHNLAGGNPGGFKQDSRLRGNDKHIVIYL
jgi:hypothetical protein